MKISGRIIQNKKIKLNSDNTFWANYKGCDILVTSDHGHGMPKYKHLTRFDITVTAKDGCYLVDDWKDVHDIKDAIRHALEGANS